MDKPITADVREEVIKSKLANDHYAQLFTKLGNELLAETEKPNVITLDQFRPYIPMFQLDHSRYNNGDDQYTQEMNRLLYAWRHVLGINMFQPTIVIVSETDRREVVTLNRRFTRIRPDLVDGTSFKEQVPRNIPKTAEVSREEHLMAATVKDVVAANTTPDQLTYFKQLREQSAVLTQMFLERNASPKVLSEIHAGNAEHSLNAVNNTKLQSNDSDEFLDDE